MPAQNYKIWAVGASVGAGATQSIYVGIAGIAKSNTPGPSTTVANELVCSRLASALLLPVPPGFLISHNNVPHFVSLDFNLAGHSLPPVDPSVVVAQHLELCWGITLFDMWVGNWDRHNRNMAHNTTTNRVEIFDHSHALLGKGVANLVTLGSKTGLEQHCLRTELTSLAGFKHWHDRIMSVPEFFIRSLVSDIAEPQFNVTAADATACTDFLLSRRASLPSIAKANMGEFPKIPAGSWNTV